MNFVRETKPDKMAGLNFTVSYREIYLCSHLQRT